MRGGADTRALVLKRGMGWGGGGAVLFRCSMQGFKDLHGAQSLALNPKPKPLSPTTLNSQALNPKTLNPKTPNPKTLNS